MQFENWSVLDGICFTKVNKLVDFFLLFCNCAQLNYFLRLNRFTGFITTLSLSLSLSNYLPLSLTHTHTHTHNFFPPLFFLSLYLLIYLHLPSTLCCLIIFSISFLFISRFLYLDDSSLSFSFSSVRLFLTLRYSYTFNGYDYLDLNQSL